MRVTSVCCLCFMFCTASALSGTLYVGQVHPYQTVQSAIDTSVSGDTIIVSPGIYHENINFLGKNITVTSTNPDDPAIVESTVIDADGIDSTVTFTNGEGPQAVLSGFTITGGYGTVNLDINAAIYWGGGIYCANASPTITQNIIQGNDGPLDEQNAVGYGGGIACFQSESIITRNNIRQNKSYAGAGIIIYFGQPIVANNVIHNNSATIGGGVVLLMGGELINNAVIHNTAQTAGNIYAGSDEGYPVWIINNIVANAQNGVGIYCQAFNQYLSILYNDVWNNTGGNYNNLPDQTGLNGNISLDPLCFDMAAGDFRLLTGSPCIDAGNNEPVSGLLPVDFNGQSRLIDGDYDGEAIVDIGAFEAEGATGPVILASTGKISFASVEGNNPQAKTLTITNGGLDVLDWTIEESCSWLEVAPLSGSSTGPGDETEVMVSIDTAGMLPGSYECSFNIVAPMALNTPKTICVTLYISAEGEIVVPLSFPTIQQAIDNAVDTNKILVLQGTYNENINLHGKNIILTSIEPTNWKSVESTIIRGLGDRSVITFAGTETSACVLRGFTITGGNSTLNGGGVSGNDCAASIQNCRFYGNTAANVGGGIWGVHGPIENCVVYNNTALAGGGIGRAFGIIRNCLIFGNQSPDAAGLNNCDGAIQNCTIVSDQTTSLLRICDGTIQNCILQTPGPVFETCTAAASYTCWPGATGKGNISDNPLFVNPAGGDYHLRAESACISAGNPAFIAQPGETDIDNDPRIIGRVEIGADEYVGNLKPTSDAGPDQTMASIPSYVTLDGSGSFDGDGDVLTMYQWQQVSGPNVILSGEDTPTATFTPAELGVYVFELVVGDGTFLSNPDRVGIVIGNNHTPIAEAGLTVYAKTGVAVLDGSGSYDRDSYGELTYQWRQITGSVLTILDAQSPQPRVSGFVQGSSVNKYEFELVVSDGVLSSKPDTVTLVVLPTFQEGILYQVNPPFNPSLPTIVAFNGGNCNTGSGMELPSGFNQSANVLTVTSYGPPYGFYGNMVVDYLYRMAPHYNQPIQTMGYSTGNMPAIDTAIYMNTQFSDVRYAVNRISFFDPACRDYAASITQYLASRVGDEPCWVENYYSTLGKYYSGALNIRFPSPPATHSTPVSWYFSSIYFPTTWPIDVYNDGVVAGAYISVSGPGKNLNVTNPNTYYFQMIGDYNNGAPGYLGFYNKTNYPGCLPHPVILTGPENGEAIDAEGAVLSCLESAHVVSYQLLFGPDPDNMNYIISETQYPPSQVITQFPFKPTYWTIRAIDAYGTTIHADPICIYPQSAYEPVKNISIGKTYPYIQLAIELAEDGEEIVVAPGLHRENIHFKGKNIILTSTNPQDPNIVASTVIQGLGSGSVITFAGTETLACVLRGFTITGGNSTLNGGGVNGNDCYASIQNCRFYGNTAANVGGGIWGVHGPIENCVVYNNTALAGGGIGRAFGIIRNCLIFGNQSPNATGLNNCDGAIQNCTIVSNQTASLLRICDGTIQNCILQTPGPVFDTCTAVVSYTCLPGATGTGNISFDPMFVDPNSGDYHLLSESPCMDAGNPASDYSLEPMPNGGRIDMGAYGNTSQATLSRNVLTSLGFQMITKTRTGRTLFEYELAVVVRNPNAYDMSNVQMKLKDWDAAVVSIGDDRITIDSIPAGATVTSTDTFKIVVDRSMLIVPGMLTWELTYYAAASGDQVQQAMMSMSLSTFNAVGGDITGDGKVNLEDFVIMAQQWEGAPGSPSADIAPPYGHVGIEDLICLAENWMN